MIRLLEILFLILFLTSTSSFSKISARKKIGPHQLFSDRELDSFYDSKHDYALFPGRVTDRDKSGHIMKVSSENANIKFFRAGDKVRFSIPSYEKGDFCESYIRSVEKGYFVIYIKDLYPCWPRGRYFRRGTQIKFRSFDLARRVRDGALYRVVLLKRKKDFLKQLAGINHFVWSFKEQQVKLASRYDQKVIELQQKKQKALEFLTLKKKDQLNVQKELIYQLDRLDLDLEHYRVEKNELLLDRWYTDRDLGLPVLIRPIPLQKGKSRRAKSYFKE